MAEDALVLAEWTVADVFASLLRELDANYVYPEVAQALAASLGRRLAEGGYADFGGEDLAACLTADAREVSGDQHLRISYRREPIPV